MKHILTILIMMLALGSYASEPSVTDSISSAEKVDTMALHAGKSWVNRILDYFNDSNKNKKHKRFDFSVIGGPHYASDTKFGLGLVAAGLYRTDPNDSILPPSNVSLYGDVSSVGFYMLGSVSESEACTNFIVGKKASVDGSVMCSYSADDYGMFQNLCHFPAGKHAKGEMRKIYDWDTNKYHGEIPEAA